MGDFEARTTVDTDENALFDYLSQVSNLPRYFTRMTSARRGDGEEVHVTADLGPIAQVEGNAWFRVDDDAQDHRVGVGGPERLPGSLQVSAAGPGAEVHARLHSTRVGDGDTEVQQGLDDTLATVKRLVEQQATSV